MTIELIHFQFLLNGKKFLFLSQKKIAMVRFFYDKKILMSRIISLLSFAEKSFFLIQKRVLFI